MRWETPEARGGGVLRAERGSRGSEPFAAGGTGASLLCGVAWRCPVELRIHTFRVDGYVLFIKCQKNDGFFTYSDRVFLPFPGKRVKIRQADMASDRLPNYLADMLQPQCSTGAKRTRDE